jgi:hypothetical protein
MAEKHGIYPRPFKRGIMYTPPSNRTRVLIWIRDRPKRDGSIALWVYPSVFAEFYPVEEAEAFAKLGELRGQASREETVEFTQRLDKFFTELAERNA